jgi:hypothetical protein
VTEGDGCVPPEGDIRSVGGSAVAGLPPT